MEPLRAHRRPIPALTEVKFGAGAEMAPRLRPYRLAPATTLAALMILLAGCAVGPDFERPAVPTVERYTPEPLPAETASAPVPVGAAQRLSPGRDIPGEWWTLFRSEPLNALIAEAFKNNPTIPTAEAALRQAHELTLAGGGGSFFPHPAAHPRREPQQDRGQPVAGDRQRQSLLQPLHRTAQRQLCA